MRNDMISKTTDSQLCKDIRLEFYQYVSWTIGNGHHIKFWEDPWINGLPSLSSIVNSEDLSSIGKTLIEFVDDSGQWKFTDESSSLLDDIKQKILEIRPPNVLLGLDVPNWKPEVNGQFSVNNAYHTISNLSEEPRLTKLASCGGTIRDTTGNWWCEFIANLGSASVLSAELWGIFHGLKTAWEQRFRKVILESDSSLAINHVKSNNTRDNSVHPVAYNIKTLLNNRWDVQLKKISRSANSCADVLAEKGLLMHRGFVLLATPPPYVLQHG
ncbi:putative ribonuclease H protein At1g65750 family [Senna tora]|uniref:Putative ribonuclease H protein At1g65750 family n=1 Tax=Senna tora TaxID=362788 RepID=A0A834WVT8_9FABA|nr:putative ribonuclease H protein At1g65750 family [Senna tora]